MEKRGGGERVKRIGLITWLVLVALGAIGGELSLPSMFSHNMVVQRDQPVVVWGKADPGTEVSVSFKHRSGTSVADTSGSWKVQLAALSASTEPSDFIVSGIVFTNVLVGDVWLCSGQSNMKWPLKEFGDTTNTIAQAAQFPLIRLLNVGNAPKQQPQDDISTRGWLVNNQKATADFSATAYYFGLALHHHLDVPVGLVNCSVGGSVAETWVSEEALEANELAKQVTVDPWNERINDPDLLQKIADSREAFEVWKRAKKAEDAGGSPAGRRPKVLGHPARHRDRPGNLFRGMIHPLIGLSIKGATWYQGESNGGLSNTMEAEEYHQILSSLITDWRSRWGQGEFPFLIVQLPSTRRRLKDPVNKNSWAEIREGQRRCLELENTGLAVICDNEDTTLHPKGKQIVGERLALLARGIAYEEDITYSGPLVVEGSIKILGSKAELKFAHAGDGLVLKDAPITGFAIRGEDGSWEHAKVRVENDMVTVWSDAVQNPVAVRYAWMGGIAPTLCNEAGLLASPFKTDGVIRMESPR